MNLNKLIVALIDDFILRMLFQGDTLKIETAKALTDILFWAHRKKYNVTFKRHGFSVEYRISLPNFWTYADAERVRDQVCHVKIITLDTTQIRGIGFNPCFF